ncbi:hypothetical protein Sgly_1790 [Syntrophobotulus glycolicus DSM 8271]|uniref:Uncharacterized protein n=1 Tax=Syntrophobotulus glycolicus (strain DSM 8271 / FlGlyR) TaxID=645991 RepID=F0SZK1_SYNGF|nr:hypothetical protein [Syntrophobotulus glycolicus]ADY56087.1 hypothetical protein Sgly_1790 [Syntrophobotulus glycolicus DSM 8271]
MTTFVTLKRRYVLYGALVLLVAFAGTVGISIWKVSQADAVAEKIEPELKIVSLDFQPNMELRDVTYGSEVFKGQQVLKADKFGVSAIIQNTTNKTMTNIPIKFDLSLTDQKDKKASKLGNIPTLEPGKTAKVTFENVKALGDAKGKSATAGQHELIISISSNPAGAVTQNTEAKTLFNVDSSIK